MKEKDQHIIAWSINRTLPSQTKCLNTKEKSYKKTYFLKSTSLHTIFFTKNMKKIKRYSFPKHNCITYNYKTNSLVNNYLKKKIRQYILTEID